jgi:ATP-dependent exoDNAse (exonuclease V) alpha subunit
MHSIDIIRIHNASFYAYHGVASDEQNLGGKFEVDVELHADLSEAMAHDSLKSDFRRIEPEALAKEPLEEPDEEPSAKRTKQPSIVIKVEQVRELVAERIPKRFGFDPRTDIQVLCPMHKSLAGTRALNQLLQETLNPGASELKYRGQTFRVGDKVMVVRNDYEKDVFNGDLGVVEGLDPEARRLHVVFDGRSLAFTDQEIDQLVLAYATTVHKSQGSEYPAVVMPLLTAHFVMLSRNLLYTAVTRARKLCVLVADRRALGLALGKLGGDERLTRLRERLERALPPLIVHGI